MTPKEKQDTRGTTVRDLLERLRPEGHCPQPHVPPPLVAMDRDSFVATSSRRDLGAGLVAQQSQTGENSKTPIPGNPRGSVGGEPKSNSQRLSDVVSDLT